jgi:beta-phosphoglucomutase
MKVLQFKAVIFDVDGLLLDTERIGLSTWTKACADFGYEMTLDIFRRMIGTRTAECNLICFNAFGDHFPFEQIRLRKVEYGREFIAKNGVPLRPGATEILEFVSAKAIPFGLATSTEYSLAMERLTVSGLLKFPIGAIVTGDQVANGKPSPEIYLKVAALLKVEPKLCIVFEDSTVGVLGAKNAGMQPIMIPDLKPPGEEERLNATFVLDSLITARDALAAWVTNDDNEL